MLIRKGEPRPPNPSPHVPAGLIEAFADEFDQPLSVESASLPAGGATWADSFVQFGVRNLAGNNDLQIKAHGGYPGSGGPTLNQLGLYPHQQAGSSVYLNSLRIPPANQAQFFSFQYTGGALDSIRTFNFSYGYIEIRARFPVIDPGMHWSLWLWSTGADYFEIDLVEDIGNNSFALNGPVPIQFFNSHDNRPGSTHSATYPNTQINTNYTDLLDWHLYAVEIDQNNVTWYLDGIQVRQIPNIFPANTLWFILCTPEIGESPSGDFPAAVQPGTRFPGVIEIDYVRVYNQNGLPVTPPANAAAIPSLTGTPTTFASSINATDPVDNLTHTSAGGKDPAVLIFVKAKPETQATPTPLTITVTYDGSNVDEEGASTATAIASSPTIKAFLLRNPPTTTNAPVQISISCADSIVARSIEIYDLVDVTGVGAVAVAGDDTVEQTSTSFLITTTQPNSKIIGQISHRGAPSVFTRGGAYIEAGQADTGSASENDDLSYLTQHRDAIQTGSFTFDASWTNQGHYQALAIELLGTVGVPIPPVAMPDIAAATAGGASIVHNVIGNDTGSGVTLTAASIASGSGSLDSFAPNGEIAFTPPATPGTTVINYTITNAGGSSSSTLIISIASSATFLAFPSGANLLFPSGSNVEFPS